jgi:hypothetical protein
LQKNPNVAKNTLKDIDEDLTYSNINFVLTKAILLNSLLSLIGSDLSYRRGLEPRSVRSEINKSSAVGRAPIGSNQIELSTIRFDLNRIEFFISSIRANIR